jgi:soluble lytic murein transglycosylase-like protein
MRIAVLALAGAFVMLSAADARSQSAPRQAAAGALERAAHERAHRRDLERYDPIFRKYAKRYFGIGVDWRYFKAQGMAESDLLPTARSRVGARGIMQLMPSTYRAISSKRPEMKAIDDPEWNIAAGIMHDRYLWTLWKDGYTDEERYRFMFAAYNAGHGTIFRARDTARVARLDQTRWQNIERIAPGVGRWRYRETLGYVKRIEEFYGKIK